MPAIDLRPEMAPEAERYARMIDNGLPRGAVIKKMKADGVDPSLLPPEGVTTSVSPKKNSRTGAPPRKPAGWWVKRAEGQGITL